MWHRDFPDDARETWDIIAKALMLRVGGTMTLSGAELRIAANTQAEIELSDDGSIRFRAVSN